MSSLININPPALCLADFQVGNTFSERVSQLKNHLSFCESQLSWSGKFQNLDITLNHTLGAFWDFALIEPNGSQMVNLIFQTQAKIVHIKSIQKGFLHKGPELKALALNIIDRLQPETATLNDFSKIFYTYSSKQKILKKISLKIYIIFPIVKEDGETWYSRNHFIPKENHTLYLAAIKKIRDTTLSDFWTYLPFSSKMKFSKIWELCELTEVKTIHELGSSLYLKAKTATLSEPVKRAFKIFIKILSNSQYNAEGLLFAKAIKIIESTREFQRSYAQPVKHITFKQYDSSYPIPFDELISLCHRL